MLAGVYSFSHEGEEKLPPNLTEGDAQMEPVAIFTSRVDLPAIAARVSAPTYRDAAVLIQDLVADRTGCFADMAFYERVVPQVFARYQPAAGTPAEPGLIPGRLYCYQTQAPRSTGCSKSSPSRTASPWKRRRSWACSTEQN